MIAASPVRVLHAYVPIRGEVHDPGMSGATGQCWCDPESVLGVMDTGEPSLAVVHSPRRWRGRRGARRGVYADLGQWVMVPSEAIEEVTSGAGAVD